MHTGIVSLHESSRNEGSRKRKMDVSTSESREFKTMPQRAVRSQQSYTRHKAACPSFFSPRMVYNSVYNTSNLVKNLKKYAEIRSLQLILPKFPTHRSLVHLVRLAQRVSKHWTKTLDNGDSFADS